MKTSSLGGHIRYRMKKVYSIYEGTNGRFYEETSHEIAHCVLGKHTPLKKPIHRQNLF